MFIMELERISLPEWEAAKILLSFAHNHEITEANTDFLSCVLYFTKNHLGASHTWSMI